MMMIGRMIDDRENDREDDGDASCVVHNARD